MYLKNWRPLIKKDQPGLIFSIRVELKCPYCRAIIHFESGGHTASAYTRHLPELIEWETKELIKHVACPRCGIVSAFPQSDHDVFMREVRATLTKSWFKEEIAKCERKLYTSA